MFWFLAVAMVVVVAAVTLAVVGGAENEVLPEAPPERLVDPLPLTRPVSRADVEALRLPLAPRGYRMEEVDDVLDRLAAELAERDARIAELESALAGAQATASGRADLFAASPRPARSAGSAGYEKPAAHDESAAHGEQGARGERDARGDRGERDGGPDGEGDR
ncbi:DivIVA domain-containing protein [Streptomyces somaliensis DSM 40738]|uniref:DivIVA domain-containing protein n=1 Tax=Streptomyces somaliensis TaxID=78355 RepID=UPI0021C46BC4|nr:DivIVA domain-containing protein [Streptomyces somaliensis]MCQ0023834.1 DivIVA domain-containing protein [Streptomyces somaliensis DSM 40738]